MRPSWSSSPSLPRASRSARVTAPLFHLSSSRENSLAVEEVSGHIAVRHGTAQQLGIDIKLEPSPVTAPAIFRERGNLVMELVGRRSGWRVLWAPFRRLRGASRKRIFDILRG